MKGREEVYSNKIRAGKRTYFFDVHSTRSDDYYITVTESKKRFDGKFEKHKIFLYKEDFNKFEAMLHEVIQHIKTELLPDYDFEEFDRRREQYAAEALARAENGESGEQDHEGEVGADKESELSTRWDD